jgi:hypothetical protein
VSEVSTRPVRVGDEAAVRVFDIGFSLRKLRI